MKNDTIDHDGLKTRVFGGIDLTHRVDLSGKQVAAFVEIDGLHDKAMQKRHLSAFYAMAALMYSPKVFASDSYVGLIDAVGKLGDQELQIEIEVNERHSGLPSLSDAPLSFIQEMAVKDPAFIRLLDIRKQLPFLLTDDLFE